ncbi:MAG TPA: hypothetical protein VK419_00845 [Bryobacteraceae bacterium]|nr:hypothetical protein [Bryobacteraceae bacterium]
MKRLLLTLGAMGVLLAAFAPRSFAGLNYNASKSNTGNIAVHPPSVPPAQVAAILKYLDDKGSQANEAGLRKILGAQSDSIKAVKIEPGPNGKGVTVLLLADPGDEGAARGVVSGKRQH